MKLVFIENNRPVTDCLTVAETFGKEHRRVLQDIRELGCSAEFRMHHFVRTPYIHPQNGQTYEKCIMTQEGFAFLAFGYTGKEADRFKEDYINEFVKMRDELNKPSFQLPQTMPEALRLLATEMEDKQRIQTENLMLEQRVKEYEPKISYLDSILQSTDTVTITQIAKDYGLTGQALNKVLHEEKVQYNVGGQWLLYQKHQDKGYTRSQTIDVHHTDGRKTVKMNTKWTQKGRLFIHETLTKRGIVPYMDREQNSKEA